MAVTFRNIRAETGNASIQFKDEGTDLGTTGTVNEIDFIGSGVSVLRVGDSLAVTIISGSGGTGISSLTGDVTATAPPNNNPDLGTGSTYATFASSTITNTGSSVITGDLGLSPGTSVTGFPPGTVSGTQHIADAPAAQAKIDFTAAYNDLVSRSYDIDETGIDLGTLTLLPGTYKYTTSAQLTGTLVLDAAGDAGAVWVFQIGSTLTTASASSVSIINGGSAGNVYWQVGTSATLGTTTNFKGTIIANASITLNTGASIDGRAVALTGALTLDTNSVVEINSVNSGSAVATISNNVVTNAKLAQMPTNTIKGNNTGSTANALDLTISQVKTMLSLDQVDNTSDLNKPVSTAQAAANAAVQAFSIQRANHTGTQLASTISDFTTAIQAAVITSTITDGDLTHSPDGNSVFDALSLKLLISDYGKCSGTGINNTALGIGAGASNTTGSYNAFFGYHAGFSNTTGNLNTFIGERAGEINTTGVNNTYVGELAGGNKNVSHNTMIGLGAGYNNAGANNTAVGEFAGYASGVTGISNVTVGAYSGYVNTTGNNNVFVGVSSGRLNTTGQYNTFVGGSAGYHNTTGNGNTFIGEQAAENLTTGIYNTAVGYGALGSSTTGTLNIAMGESAGYSNTTGARNVFLGEQAGYTLTPANASTTSSDVTFIGTNSGASTTTQITNAVAIGSGVTIGASDAYLIGKLGAKHYIFEGANGAMGASTLVGGTVVVSNTRVTANSRIFLTNQNGAGTVGASYVSARTAGTSFTITSTSGTDTSLIAWEIKEPR